MISRVLSGRYRLTQELGRGATAIVFRADDLTLGTEVAVKVLAPHLARDADALGRFERELKTARQVTSEAVAQVYELGEDGGTRYVVLELWPTGTLKDFILLNGPVPLVQLDRLLEQLADALFACHEQGILHRDLKPSNILFDPASGRIKLIDFGVARFAGRPPEDAVGSVIGTPEYMAPEQFEDPVPDPRSDLYSAGAVLYEAATGRLAVSGRSLPEVVRKHREGVRVSPRRLNPQIGPGLEAIVLRLLAPDPGDRFQTADELREAAAGSAKREPPVPEAAFACPECGARREKGLPFCPSCARSLERFDRFGRWSVVVSAMPPGARLAAFLESRLPAEAMPGRATVGTLPITAVQLASEPLARWLADELRAAGFAASVHCLPLGLIPLATVAGYSMSLLLGFAAAGLTAGQRAPVAVLAVVGGAAVLLALFLAYVIRGYARRHFVALRFLPPVRRPASVSGFLARALELQGHLTSPRLRRIGRDLLVHAFHREGAPSAAGSADIVETAYQVLGALDLQVSALHTAEAASVRAAREDAILRGTQSLLRITALCRRERAAAVRRTAGRLEGQKASLGERRSQLEAESARTLAVLDELRALGPGPTRPRRGEEVLPDERKPRRASA